MDSLSCIEAFISCFLFYGSMHQRCNLTFDTFPFSFLWFSNHLFVFNLNYNSGCRNYLNFLCGMSVFNFCMSQYLLIFDYDNEHREFKQLYALHTFYLLRKSKFICLILQAYFLTLGIYHEFSVDIFVPINYKPNKWSISV